MSTSSDLRLLYDMIQYLSFPALTESPSVRAGLVPIGEVLRSRRILRDALALQHRVLDSLGFADSTSEYDVDPEIGFGWGPLIESDGRYFTVLPPESDRFSDDSRYQTFSGDCRSWINSKERLEVIKHLYD